MTLNSRLYQYIDLIRVHQWVKNCFVFLPMFFNKQLVDSHSIFNALLAFFSFSLVASSVYCLNDINDVNYDRQHVVKKNRPIASGAISVSRAKRLMIILAVLGLLLAVSCNGFGLGLVLLCYLVINILYTLVLKKIIILDVFIIAISFLLRILAGGVATHTVLSFWIIIMVVLLALFLGFAKRRDEYLTFLYDAVTVRPNINKYSLAFLDGVLYVLAALILVFYILYTLLPETTAHYKNNYVWLTSIFVFLGLFRYLKMIKKRHNFANPTRILLSDNVIQAVLFLWLLSFYFIIYKIIF